MRVRQGDLTWILITGQRRNGREQDERDKVLENIYLSVKMKKYHPLMTKELRKSYGLMASAAMRAMTPEFKYGVKKLFNQMSTTMKAMSAAELIKVKCEPVSKMDLW